jgi:hypothetical protein
LSGCGVVDDGDGFVLCPNDKQLDSSRFQMA